MIANNNLRLSIAQMATVPGGGDYNISKMHGFMKQAKTCKADIVCFHELTICDYANIEKWSEIIPGKITNKIREKAKEIGIGVIIGLPEIKNGKLFNTAIIIDPEGRLVGKYSKTHLSFDARSNTVPREVDIFLPGDKLSVFDTWLGKIGLMICKDGLFPEVPRTLSLKGAEIIFWLNNRGKLNPAHLESIANLNRIVLVASNRAEEKGLAGGGSAIVYFEDSILDKGSFSHSGSFISYAGQSETILFGTVNLAVMRERRKAWINNWLNRQPKVYEL